jgi:hypothetical protein
MPLRDRAESAAALALLIACVAFVASFALGLRRGSEPPAQADAAGPAVPAERVAGRVEVLNASGRGGLARTATAQLRDAGFDVVFYGNAPGSSGDSSVVIDRTGSDEVARAAARRLGIGRVRSDRDTTLFLDATIILGRDWPPDAAEPEAGTGAPPADGWRDRFGRWLRPS